MSRSTWSEGGTVAASRPAVAAPRRAVAALTVFLSAWAPPVLAQCSMCARSAEGSLVGRGLSFSVLFLLGALALVITWFIVTIVRSRPEAATEPPRPHPSREAHTS